VIVNIGLPGWFAATGLRVMVKQPDSRGIPCFFVAIFSVITQFDVCPVGWYNRRMEFLGRTGGGYQQDIRCGRLWHCTLTMVAVALHQGAARPPATR